MSSMAGLGDMPASSQYQVLVDRCRMLEASQAELRRQFSDLLLEKENSAAAAAAADGDSSGGGRIPGFFSCCSPYRGILESIGHAVYVYSPSTGEILYWNRSAENLYGWKYSEVIGKRMDQLLVSQEQHAQLENILEGLNFEQPWSGQFPFKRQTGEIFMAMTTKSLLYEDGELAGVITVSSDATHFNCVNLEHQRSNQERANGLPKGPSLNSKRIQWHPQSVAVPQIVSSVSNLASKVLPRRSAESTSNESAVRWNDRTDTKDDLLKKPARLAEKFLERLHIGGDRGWMQESDKRFQHDGNVGRPEINPLLNVPGMSKPSTSSQGTVCIEDQKNLIENNSSVPTAEREYLFAYKSMDQTCISSGKPCSQCFDLPKPEDLPARVGSEAPEIMGRKITLHKDGEMAEKAQREHDEHHSPSSGGGIGSHGNALSRGDSDFSSLCDCEVQWEDLQIGEEIDQVSV